MPAARCTTTTSRVFDVSADGQRFLVNSIGSSRDRRRRSRSSSTGTQGLQPAKLDERRSGRSTLARGAQTARPGDTGAIVAVTLQGADQGDTTTIIDTTIAAAEQIQDAQADVEEPQSVEAIIADKGYHSNQSMVDLDAVGIRS